MEEIDPVPQGRDAPGDTRRGVGVYDRPDNKAKTAAVIAALAIFALAFAMFLLLRRA